MGGSTVEVVGTEFHGLGLRTAFHGLKKFGSVRSTKVTLGPSTMVDNFYSRLVEGLRQLIRMLTALVSAC